MPVDTAIPFTEQSNELSSKLDGTLTAPEFLRTLRSCDSQVFGGYKGEYNIYDSAIACNLVVQGCSAILRKREGRDFVVMTGCGTSGRVAFLTSRRYSQLLAQVGLPSAFRYAIAAGDSAILLSDEVPEDDPIGGQHDLQVKLGDDCNTGYLIGITCGLSAPYVAGQVAKALQCPEPIITSEGIVANDTRELKLGVALIGFNPGSLARNVPLPTLGNRSFRDVVADLERCGSSPFRVLLNPIVGPEPVAGSSRMKGGSVTAVLLDVICLKACYNAALLPTTHRLYALASMSVPELISEYQRCHALTYACCSSSLPPIMDICAQAIRQGGHIYYIGAGSGPIVGCIDASEMPDTYGAPFSQTRGFVAGGWAALGNSEGDLSHQSYLHRIGLNHFMEDIAPTLSSNDSVVVLISGNDELDNPELHGVIEHVAFNTTAAISYLVSSSQSEATFLKETKLGVTISSSGTDRTTAKYAFVRIPHDHNGFHDLAIKLMTNALSTYAQAVGRGALYKSFMIATGPANDKIYSRCIDLISTHVGVTKEEANIAIIRSVYGVDQVDQSLLGKPRIEIIKHSVLAADKRDQSQIVLPVAFLCEYITCVYCFCIST